MTTTKAEPGHASACDVFRKLGPEIDVCTCSVARRVRLAAVIGELRALAHEDGADRDLEPAEALARIRTLLKGVDEGEVAVVPATALSDVVAECDALREKLKLADRDAGIAADVALTANAEAIRYQRERDAARADADRLDDQYRERTRQLVRERDTWHAEVQRLLDPVVQAKMREGPPTIVLQVPAGRAEELLAELRSPVHYGTSVQIACFAMPDANPKKGQLVTLEWAQVTCPHCLTRRP